MKAFIRSIFLILPFLFNTSMKAQDSLEHYVAVAIEKNPAVLQKYNEYKASLEKVVQAGVLSDPQLNAGVLIKPMELVMGKQLAEFQLMQMFPWFGTLRAAKDEMSLMANAKFESLSDAKLQTAFNVQNGWFELYKVSQQLLIAQNNLEILRSVERLAITRYKTSTTGNVAASELVKSPANQTNQGSESMGGMGKQNTAINTVPSQEAMNNNSMGSTGSNLGLPDLYRIHIEIGDVENNIAYLETQRKVLIARFNTYLNRSSDYAVVLPDTLVADSIMDPVYTQSDSMLLHNPMLAMIEYERQSLEARKKMVNKMGYPMIGLGLNYTVIQKNEMSDEPMNGKDMVMPMISSTLPIYRKKYKSMRNEADYLIQATENNYEETVRNLELEYNQAMQLYTDAFRRRNLYDEQWKLSKKSLEIMLRSFSVSSTYLTDILRFRQLLLDYGFKYIEAIVDIKTAEAWLKRLSGGI